jgi:hypothetical protein
LISLDEKTDHLKLLGGMIDVNGQGGQIQIGGKNFSSFGDNSKGVSGTQTVDPSRFSTILVPFANGKINLQKSKDSSVHWDCKFDGPHGSGQLMERSGLMVFDFGDRASVKCDIQLPKHLKTHLEGANGDIDIEHPQGDVEVNLTNGKVSMLSENDLNYHYDLHVKRGLVADFQSSNDPQAIKIKMEIVNGAISNETEN